MARLPAILTQTKAFANRLSSRVQRECRVIDPDKQLELLNDSRTQYHWAVANVLIALLCVIAAGTAFMFGHVVAGLSIIAVSVALVVNAGSHKKRGIVAQGKRRRDQNLNDRPVYFHIADTQCHQSDRVFSANKRHSFPRAIVQLQIKLTPSLALMWQCQISVP